MGSVGCAGSGPWGVEFQALGFVVLQLSRRKGVFRRTLGFRASSRGSSQT